MNEPMPPPLPEAPTGSRISLGAKLMGVFIAPGEVFEDVIKSKASTPNWLVPTLLLALVGVLSVWITLSQDSIVQQIKEQQERAIQKKLEKVPKEQREQIMEMAEKWTSPLLMKIGGSFMAAAGSFALLFLTALALWLLGAKLFKGSFTFMQVVEVCGLASMIAVLGTMIRMLLIVIMGSMMATPSPGLLIREPDPANLLHLLLSAFNVMTLWYVAVLGIGLSRLSRIAVAKAAAWLFGLWALLTSGMVILGWIAQRAAQ